MAPPCHSSPASALPATVQLDWEGKRRKLDPTVGRIDLTSCELLRIVQWRQGEISRDPNSFLTFRAVERFFRRCKDKNGTFTVETTAWENHHPSKQDGTAKPPLQWSTSWLDD
ncbi:hypothetical protein CP533_4319 [Ophiocordyceps camponoti-saundersi (nom. inval.)]|nr:hypothetical protein CP533_4319 [Ophiocordyceps camponoti-saundersi (nom. inval.)]